MAIERIVDPSLNNRGDDGAADEQIIEVTLRPTNFNEYIGQSRLKKNLQLSIDAARKRKEPIDHVLLYGHQG